MGAKNIKYLENVQNATKPILGMKIKFAENVEANVRNILVKHI